MMWVLVLLVCFNTCEIDSVPGAYTTLEKCREAARVAHDGMNEVTGLCIPAPDGLYEVFE